MAWWSRRRSRWAGIDFLSLQPEHCVEYQEDATEGRVVLLVPRFRSGLLARWLQPRLRPERAHFRVTLEDRGSWIWRQCDGQRTVGEMVADFNTAFPDETEQVAERVCQFLYQLSANEFVTFSNLPENR
jgi:hypothetical protein